MTYNLFGFASTGFEQFVQSTAVHVIGPGIVIFGKGPDGGREATFDGNIPFPFATAGWNGYGVVQAKCKEKTEGTEIDQQWALDQLEAELTSFVSSKKRKRKPEYYIFATNVVFTPVAGSGGKDKAEELIRKFYGRLPLKGHFIWDADQLKTYLDTYAELRKRFNSYTTPGDVLAELAKSIKQRDPDFVSTMIAFLDRELRNDEDARLDQAGNRLTDQTPLAKVFIDLSASPTPLPDPLPEAKTEGRLPDGFLAELLRVGERALDPKSLAEIEAKTSDGGVTKQFTNRFVLLGGPGSGKSTLSQFLAQIHRAAILSKQEPHLLTKETRGIVSDLQQICALKKFPWPLHLVSP